MLTFPLFSSASRVEGDAASSLDCVAAAVSVSGLTPQLIGQDGQPLTDALTRVRTAAAEISRQLQDMHWAR